MNTCRCNSRFDSGRTVFFARELDVNINFMSLFCAANFARLQPKSFARRGRLSPVNFSHNDYRLQNRCTINAADIQRNEEGVDYSGTRA